VLLPALYATCVLTLRARSDALAPAIEREKHSPFSSWNDDEQLVHTVALAHVEQDWEQDSHSPLLLNVPLGQELTQVRRAERSDSDDDTLQVRHSFEFGPKQPPQLLLQVPQPEPV